MQTLRFRSRRAAGPSRVFFVAKRAVLLAGALTLAGLALVPEGRAQDQPGQEAASAPKSPRDGQKIKDWTLRCGRPGGADAPETCEMRQQPLDDSGKPLMLVAIGHLPDTPQPGLLVVLPLGISLPAGVTIKIDDGEDMAIPVERCLPQGCRIEAVMQPDVVARFKAGNAATITFHAYDRQGKREDVSVPISLQGFTAALAEVTK